MMTECLVPDEISYKQFQDNAKPKTSHNDYIGFLYS